MSKKEDKLSYMCRRSIGNGGGYNAKSTLTDIIGSELYFSLKDTKDTFIDTTKKDYSNAVNYCNTTIDKVVNSGLYKNISAAINDNKAALLGLCLGTAVSAFSNFISTSIVASEGFNYDGIDWWSFIGEVLPHAAVSAGAFFYVSKIRGRSFTESWKELTYLVTPVAAAISFGPYRLLRDYISNSFMDSGVLPKWATLAAQGILFLPYLAAVVYSLKGIKSTKFAKKYLDRWHQQGIENNSVKKVPSSEL
jgi:hypothetical protein